MVDSGGMLSKVAKAQRCGRSIFVKPSRKVIITGKGSPMTVRCFAVVPKLRGEMFIIFLECRSGILSKTGSRQWCSDGFDRHHIFDGMFILHGELQAASFNAVVLS